MKIELLDSIEAVIEKSDVLIVLSPDNPEMHKELCRLPLQSGKLTYVDKTFAPDKAAAVEIFRNADEHGTKCYSSSALRFASELKNIDKNSIYKIYSEGPGIFDIYSIHQIEPIVMLMNAPAKRVMAVSDKAHPSLIIEFADGRLAQLQHKNDADFKVTAVDAENNSKDFVIHSDFFGLFIENLIEFFNNGSVPVPHEQTVDVIAIREAGIKAFETPFEWVEI